MNLAPNEPDYKFKRLDRVADYPILKNKELTLLVIMSFIWYFISKQRYLKIKAILVSLLSLQSFTKYLRLTLVFI